MKILEKLLGEIVIYDCPQFTKVRLGRANDGGYVVLDEICQGAKRLYSYGIGDDCSFEIDFLNRYPKAVADLFDPNMSAPPQEHERLVFYPEEISFRNAHKFRPSVNAVMKMDIEWNEWEVLRFMHPVGFRRLAMLIVEFHFLHVAPRDGLTPYFRRMYKRVTNDVNVRLFRTYSRSLRVLNQIFYCFHAHANNSLPVVTSDNLTFPPLLEMGFVRKNLVDEVVLATGPFPTPGLDMPNKTDRPDILDWYPLIKE